MVFSSLTFLCFFLPCVTIAYFLFRNRVYRNIILLIFSLLFYSWGEPKYILLMLSASLVAYVGGLLIGHYESHAMPTAKRCIFIITLVFLVGNLFVFKYLNFFCDNFNLLLPGVFSIKKILLPIGISFYTFQILSYVIDLYRNEISVQRNYFYLTLYVSFFPQLIAGPIVRYQTVEKEIKNRQESLADITNGLQRFIIGLAKKVILADNIAAISSIIYAGDPSVYGTSVYWLAALAYTLQIYFDFSGYSDMAIGLGRIFGFHFLENFNYPYTALSITDFWRRWHISLSSWFRDYIYIPLGGNRTSKWRWVVNILVVWCLTGLWHGAEWNFVLWGLYYAALLLMEKLFLHKLLNKFPKVLCWVYTFFLVNVGWVIFNLTDFHQMITSLQQMFIYQSTNWVDVVVSNTSILSAILYIPIGIIFMFPIAKKVGRKQTVSGVAIESISCLLLFALCIVCIISSSFTPFIYFRF